MPRYWPEPHETIFSVVSGLCGEHGYPEELKLAHMTSVLSAIEVIELQAAAINLHGLEMKRTFGGNSSLCDVIKCTY